MSTSYLFRIYSAEKDYNLPVKILIIEDDHRIADTLKKGLMLENLVVDVAYDGKIGYDLAANENMMCW